MEDKGMTREELGSAKRSTDAVALRCEQLRESLIRLRRSIPVAPEQAGAATEKWMETASFIGRQISSLAADIVPQLDHWVFEPKEPGGEPSALPELLRTRLTEEQERKDAEILEAAQTGATALNVGSLTGLHRDIGESVNRIEAIFPDSKLAELRAKKPRTMAHSDSSSNPKATALPILRVWSRNDRDKQLKLVAS